jgi:hypothetical protein
VTVVVGFELGGWDHSDAAVESAVVEPVDVFEGGELDVVETAPGAVPVDEFPLVQPVEGLGEGVSASPESRSEGVVVSELSRSPVSP